MLERAEARHGVERTEALPADSPGVLEVYLEPVPAAGRQLRRGQRHPYPVPPRARAYASSGPQPQPRSSNRRPGPIPTCSAT